MTRSRLPLRALVSAILVAQIAAEAPASGQALAGCPIFPTDSIWNARVDALPLDPDSGLYVATIGSTVGVHPDFGSGEWPPGSGAPIGIPFDVVDSSQPRVPITFLYDDESDPGPYPVPPDASIEGGDDATGDRHVLVLERDSCTVYELFDAHPFDGGAWWSAGSGALFALDSYLLRPDGWTSADAAGLPILPGLVRFDEVEAGRIGHALRFTAPETRKAYVWPARHFASSLTDDRYPPMGQRFRLRSGFSLSGFPPRVQVILQALKEYGMILADNGSPWYISGVPDEGWDNDELAELGAVKGSDFEAVDVSSLMVDPDSSQVVLECTAETDVSVTDRTIVTEELFAACDEIAVGANVSILGPQGRAVLSAGNRVTFGDGLTLNAGGAMQVWVGLPLISE